MPRPTITPEQATKKGFLIDSSVYPWYAYKGNRFAPDEVVQVMTDREAELQGKLERIRRREGHQCGRYRPHHQLRTLINMYLFPLSTPRKVILFIGIIIYVWATMENNWQWAYIGLILVLGSIIRFGAPPITPKDESDLYEHLHEDDPNQPHLP